MTFAGSLNSQKLQVLWDIAWSLGLLEDGTQDNLITHIKAHFDTEEHHHLCENECYIGLLDDEFRNVMLH
jgi:hypothetical protein